MATVYLAEDLKHERQVAVKVLRPELAAALGPERFLREIKIAASLTHPHILPLHDSGEADGFLYYASRRTLAGDPVVLLDGFTQRPSLDWIPLTTAKAAARRSVAESDVSSRQFTDRQPSREFTRGKRKAT